MANLTIVIDDDLLRRARVRAAGQGTSVDAVLRGALKRYADPVSGHSAAEEFLSLARKCSGRSAPQHLSWTREELHLERPGG